MNPELKIEYLNLELNQSRHPVEPDTGKSANRIIHKFNPVIASCYRSISSAVIFQYIKYRCAEDGWTFQPRDPETDDFIGDVEIAYRSKDISLGRLIKIFPYLGMKAVRLALWRLWSPEYQVDYSPLLERRRIKGTSHYQYKVKDDAFRELPDLKDSSLHRFDVAIAQKVGILTAVIYENIRFQVIDNWDDRVKKFKGDYRKAISAATHYISPSAWQERRGYASLATVERAFQKLQKENLIVKAGVKFDKVPIWTLPNSELNRIADEKMQYHPHKLSGIGRNILEDSDL